MVAVIGGGPLVRQRPYGSPTPAVPVTLIEGGPSTGTLGENLAPAAKPLLRALGAWDSFLEDRHRPSHGNRSAWGSSLRAEYTALADHARAVTRAFGDYLDEHAAYYSVERRWPDSAFWRRRAAAPARPRGGIEEEAR